MIQTCRSCGENRDHAVRGNGAPQTWCKNCQREYSRQHYRKNKEEHNRRRQANKADQQAQMRQMVNEIKAVPCMDCKVQYPSYVMHFDHRDRATKKFSISNFITLGVSLKALMNEIEKCDVVCANCHAERTFGKNTG